MKFIVTTPPARRNSQGVMSLHRLASELHKQGHTVRLLFYDVQGHGPALLFHDDEALFGFSDIPRGAPEGINDGPSLQAAVQNDWVVVYPETVPGNPLEATHVVRYELNRRGLLANVPPQRTPGEFVMAHSKMLTPDADFLLPSAPWIHKVKEASTKALSPKYHTRHLNLSYAGKGGIFGQMQVANNTLEVLRDWPSHDQLLYTLGHTNYLFTWDSYSALNAEAFIMGAVPILLQTAPFTPKELRADYLSSYVPATVQWSGDKVYVGHLPSDTKIAEIRWRLMDRATKVEKRYPANVRKMVSLLQEKWGL